MKKRIIRIKDVSQIDTSRASVYDLNNRYIDPLGNIFGLRYNKENRKVEIIKLERFLAGEERIIQSSPKQRNSAEIQFDNDTFRDNRNDNYPDESFEPDIFIEDVINNAETHQKRISGLIKNLYDSNVFPKENKQESAEFDDIVRGLEIDGIQQLEKLETYYRELTNYPRSITYYQAKIDNRGKQVYEQLSGNKERTMRFIFLYEMSTNIHRVYTNLRKHVEHLDDFTSYKNIDEQQYVTKYQKQSFLDARTSLSNTLQDIDEILTHNENLFYYSCNVKNYR